ncbi:MAG: class I SAM-dependent rRNA methyltransferase [Calditrichaeota bacterium]|nr:class I SAM-dependent rRNA methyltransferase [Calditrichota bacterium]
METRTMRLARNEDRRLRAGHLWIYSNEVDTAQTPLKQFGPGEQARVETHSGQLLGMAFVNPQSLICGRMVSRDESPLGPRRLKRRLEQALALRERLFSEPCYRLVHGESDLLPGLVVDRFGDHLSVQLNTAGMDRLGGEIVDTLRKLLKPASILLRNDSGMRTLEGLERTVEDAFGVTPDEVELIENGLRMRVPLRQGQKTGWFYDQRPNRAWLQGHARDARVLDVFSYVGAFSLQAAAHGASEVVAVDSSALALDFVARNAELNGVGERVSTRVGDAFDVLKELKDEDQRFDIVVVDPPAFIKRKKDSEDGLRAYRRIFELGMRLLSPDGLLLAASCSMHLSRDQMVDTLRASGRHLDRHVQILAEGGQGPDHPIHPAIPETRYLKAMLCRVYLP